MRYPLDWPPEQARHSGRRDPGPYQVTLDRAQRDLVHELELLRAREVVISTGIRVRQDGYAYASARDPDDPGVAVYWTRDGQDYAVACDRYRDVRSNLRACGLAIHHLRRLEQAAPSFAEKAFSGFARLAANAGADGSRPWRDVLGFDGFVPAEQIEKRYRSLARERHPDLDSGSAAAMAELNRARADALEEIGS